MNRPHPQPTYTRGFTLIELMVVIAIIAILAAVGITIFSGQQKSARDSRRKADISAIAKSLESSKGSATTYGVLYGTSFAGGAIPIDSANSTGTYAVCYTATSANSVAGNGVGMTWDVAASAFPTAPTTNCNAGTWNTISASNPAAATANWIICARLESSTGTTTAGGLQVYCRTNSQ